MPVQVRVHSTTVFRVLTQNGMLARLEYHGFLNVMFLNTFMILTMYITLLIPWRTMGEIGIWPNIFILVKIVNYYYYSENKI